MKTLLIFVLALLSCFNLQAQTNGYLEVEGLFRSVPKGQDPSNYNQTGLYTACYLTHRDSGQTVGWYAWSLTNKDGWAESYGGLTWSAASWLELSAGAGLENAAQPWRANVNAFLGYKAFSLLSIEEYGGSGWWYNHELMYNFVNIEKVEKNLKFLAIGQCGLVAKRYYGTGIIVRASIIPYHDALMVCSSIFFYDPELKKSMKSSLSLRYNF